MKYLLTCLLGVGLLFPCLSFANWLGIIRGWFDYNNISVTQKALNKSIEEQMQELPVEVQKKLFNVRSEFRMNLVKNNGDITKIKHGQYILYLLNNEYKPDVYDTLNSSTDLQDEFLIRTLAETAIFSINSMLREKCVDILMSAIPRYPWLVEVLRYIANKDTAPYLRAKTQMLLILHDPEDNMRITYMDNLIQMGVKFNEEELNNIMEVDRWKVRQAFMESLEQYIVTLLFKYSKLSYAKIAMQVLIEKGLNDPRPEVQQKAVISLVKIMSDTNAQVLLIAELFHAEGKINQLLAELPEYEKFKQTIKDVREKSAQPDQLKNAMDPLVDKCSVLFSK